VRNTSDFHLGREERPKAGPMTYRNNPTPKQLSMFPLSGQRLNITPDLNKKENALAQHTSQSDLPQLYHGSPSAMKPGTTLNLGGQWSKQWTYATSNPITALQYAAGRDDTAGDKGQGTLWSLVHKVEPVPGNEVFKDASEHGDDTSAFVSKKFKVTEPSHLVDNQTGEPTPLGKNDLPLDTPRKKYHYQPTLPGTTTGA